jgi:hypothetical protein
MFPASGIIADCWFTLQLSGPTQRGSRLTQEQKTIAQRLGIVAGVLLVLIAVVYFIYSPKEQASKQIYPAGQKKSIAAVFRAGAFLVDSNGTGRWEGPPADTLLPVGNPGDIPLTGTWDLAEGPSVGVYRDGVFTLIINGRPQKFNYGLPGDLPVVGDWSGDGRSKIGVMRKGVWMLDLNGNFKWEGNGIDRQLSLGGLPGEIPLVGDWNGDGKDDVGVYRPDTAFFAIDANGNNVWDKDDKFFAWGQPGSTPIVGDWNGDGRSKIGTFRDGFWTLDLNGNTIWDGVGKDQFIALGGVAGDLPVVGDWNGNGRSKVGIYRQGVWYVDTDGNGTLDKADTTWFFGNPTDFPMVIAPVHTKKK